MVYLKDRNKTVVCLNFTYPLKIDKIYAKMSSDRRAIAVIVGRVWS